MLHTARPFAAADSQAVADPQAVAVPQAVVVPQNTVQGATQLSVKFWGVRGSVPTPIVEHQRYGGNTVCVEVTIDDQRIIFDGGTGLVVLGQHLQRQHTPSNAHIFFTHTQWDRIQGFPFFQPAFATGNHFSLYGGTAPNGASLKHCLTDQMLQPHFSLPLQTMQADLDFHTLTTKSSFKIGDILVETIQTNPVTQALGYRLTWQGRTLVYATDTPSQWVDLPFLQFLDQADLVLYDGTYADLGYLKKASAPGMVQPWEIGLDIAQKAHVETLVLLHHSPVQTDTMLDQLQADVRDRAPNAKIAYEGMVLSL